jgi:hypothetical protein
VVRENNPSRIRQHLYICRLHSLPRFSYWACLSGSIRPQLHLQRFRRKTRHHHGTLHFPYSFESPRSLLLANSRQGLEYTVIDRQFLARKSITSRLYRTIFALFVPSTLFIRSCQSLSNWNIANWDQYPIDHLYTRPKQSGSPRHCHLGLYSYED